MWRKRRGGLRPEAGKALGTRAGSRGPAAEPRGPVGWPLPPPLCLRVLKVKAIQLLSEASLSRARAASKRHPDLKASRGIFPSRLQEAFDEAVNTNIEDFDMSREEAIKSAIEEFKVQGYDLSGVVTDLAGSDMDSHPVALAVQALRRAADGEGSLPEALEALNSRFKVEKYAAPYALLCGPGV